MWNISGMWVYVFVVGMEEVVLKGDMGRGRKSATYLRQNNQLWWNLSLSQECITLLGFFEVIGCLVMSESIILLGLAWW